MSANNNVIPDGPRVSKLQKALMIALSSALNQIKEEDLVHCFSSVDIPRDVLVDFFQQFKTQVTDSVSKEFEDISNESNVAKNLNMIDQLIAESKLNEEFSITAPPFETETAEEKIQRVITQTKAEELKRLQVVLESRKEERDASFSRLQGLELQRRDLQKYISQQNERLNKIAAETYVWQQSEARSWLFSNATSQQSEKETC